MQVDRPARRRHVSAQAQRTAGINVDAAALGDDVAVVGQERAARAQREVAAVQRDGLVVHRHVVGGGQRQADAGLRDGDVGIDVDVAGGADRDVAERAVDGSDVFGVDRVIRRIEQPEAVIAGCRRGIHRGARDIERIRRRRFDEAAVAARAAALGAVATAAGGQRLRPQGDGAAVAGVACIGVEMRVIGDRDGLRALPMRAADGDAAAAGLAGDVQRAGHVHVGTRAGQDDFAALGDEAPRLDHARGVDDGIDDVACRRRSHHDLAGVGDDGAGVFSLEAMRAADREVQQAVAVEVDAEGVARAHLQARRVALNHARVAHAGCDQQAEARVMNGDTALVLDDRAAVARAIEVHRACGGHEAGVVDIRRRSDEAADVDMAGRADQHAVGVDDEHAAVRGQVAVDLRRLLAVDHAVERDGGARGLDEARRFAGGGVEVAPLNDRAAGMLVDRGGRAARRDRRGTADDIAARRHRMRARRRHRHARQGHDESQLAAHVENIPTLLAERPTEFLLVGRQAGGGCGYGHGTSSCCYKSLKEGNEVYSYLRSPSCVKDYV